MLRSDDRAANLRRAYETDELSIALGTGILMERFAVQEDERSSGSVSPSAARALSHRQGRFVGAQATPVAGYVLFDLVD